MTDSQELADCVIGQGWSADCDITSATPILASPYDLPITDLPSIELQGVDGSWTLLSCVVGARAGA